MSKNLDKINKIIGSKLTLEEALKLEESLREVIEDKKEEVQNLAETAKTDDADGDKKEEIEKEKLERDDANGDVKEPIKEVIPVTKDIEQDAIKRKLEEAEAELKKLKDEIAVANTGTQGNSQPSSDKEFKTGSDISSRLR